MRRSTTFPRVTILFVLLAALTFVSWGCGDSTGPDQDVSVIEGRVSGGTGFGVSKAGKAAVEGATVTIRQFRTDGTLETVSREAVETDEEGRFVLATGLDGVRLVVVVATKGSRQWSALVSSQLRRGETVPSPPLNDETTLEASVYGRILVGLLGDVVSYADIQSAIDSAVAGAAASLPSLRDWLVLGTEAFALTEKGILTSDSIRVSQAALDRIRGRKLEAQAGLEAGLHAARDDGAVQDALASFDGAMIRAYVEEGVEAGDHAMALIAGLKALEKTVMSAGETAQNAVGRRAALRKARSLEEAMRVNFEILGADEAQLEALRGVGESLESALAAAGTTGDLSAAFRDYHDEILEALATVREEEASIIRAMDQYITFASGIHRRFVEDVVQADPMSLSQVYGSYFNEVRGFILGAQTDLTREQLSSLADILTLITLYN